MKFGMSYKVYYLCHHYGTFVLKMNKSDILLEMIGHTQLSFVAYIRIIIYKPS